MAINQDLGTLTVEITSDTSGLEKSQETARNALKKTKLSVDDAAKAFATQVLFIPILEMK